MLAWSLAFLLAAHLGAHVTLAIGLGQNGPWWRGAIALLVPPLAPVWGWGAGMRGRVYAWAIALALYALGVAAA